MNVIKAETTMLSEITTLNMEEFYLLLNQAIEFRMVEEPDIIEVHQGFCPYCGSPAEMYKEMLYCVVNNCFCLKFSFPIINILELTQEMRIINEKHKYL